jgi:predicted dehydrogenase
MSLQEENDMNTVRWGLLSTANINRKLIPAIRASERGELVAVASRSVNSAESYAKEWNIPQAFGSYEAMLASDDVDAVYIGLPNHLHAPWTIKALDAGKHVLCEKPFALTLAEVDAMIAASERNQRVLMEAFMYRHHPQTKIVGDWIRAGKLGEIAAFQGLFSFNMGSSRDNVRLNPAWGGGANWDVGVYPMSFAQYVFGGPPVAVSAQQWLGPEGVDETFVGQMIYADGGMAQFTCGFRMPFQMHVEVIGTEGRIAVDRPFTGMDQPNEGVIFYNANGDAEAIDVPDKELYLGQIQNMHAAILDGAPTYLTLAETRDHIKTALALYESAENGGKLVKLDAH